MECCFMLNQCSIPLETVLGGNIGHLCDMLSPLLLAACSGVYSPKEHGENFANYILVQ